MDTTNLIVKRSFPTQATDKSLRVMQWNILCDALSDAFDRVPGELLKWNYREPLIIQHIKDLNADVVCLEEVDKFDEIIKGLDNYSGKCIMKADGVMGCAILWHKERVTLVGDVESAAYVGENGKVQN